MTAYRPVVLALVFLLCACTPGRWKVTEENDYFSKYNHDHDYTQGLIVSQENEERRINIGQKIFTPIHKKISPAPRNERPYAATLWAGYDRLSHRVEGVARTTTTLGIEGGIVGPSAYGKEVQCGFHAAIGQRCPSGWSDQLHTEPGLTLRAGTEREEPSTFLLTRGTTSYNIQASAGNFLTELQMGTTVRYQITPWLETFAGPQMHLVARDILLDGNTFRDSAHIGKKWYYTEATGGFSLDFPHFPRTTWFIRVQSKQWDGQPTAYNYGGVEFSWEN